MSYHISYQIQGGFEINIWENLKFPIHGEVEGGTLYPMHDMFVFTINIIETLCLCTNIASDKMRFLHPTMQWNHIKLHFGTKRPLGSLQYNLYKLFDI